jgi:prolipoprotein diacylglyceryltransferase
MQQVLFQIPFTSLPLYGFGAMLFLCFVLTAMIWGPRRSVQIGLSRERLQDMAIVIFLTGITGARILYLIQYPDQIQGKGFWDKVLEFFKIWNGGIILYGSILGGVLGYVVFYFLVLKKLNISTWKLADAVAPLIALGLAVGRIGCYLNGCCWGQVACPECHPVPLSASLGEFPLLPAHARDQVVRPATANDRLPHIRGLQTSTGFSVRPFDPTVVAGVEPGSAAAAAGLKPEDRIVEVNGQPNRIEKGTDPSIDQKAEKGIDRLSDQVANWERGRNHLDLVVERGEEKIALSFTPRTVPFFPTQLYETVSMLLLIGVLLAFQPFRRHNGQMMVVFMVGYAIHRFFNEAIRIEPTYQIFTLSQWISVFILLAALGLELYLRKTQPPLAPGPQPLGA